MAGGADKVITYDPPGAIGLFDRAPIVLLRFDDSDPAIAPMDLAGGLQDLGVLVSKAVTGVTLAVPGVVTGAVGRARQFDPHIVHAGFSARDVVSGSTLLTRDVTIQTILSWNAAHQDLGVGNIISRGLGTASPAEFVAYGLQITLISPTTMTGSLSWFWQDTAGTFRTQTSAQFICLPGNVTMLTATRRWISPTSVLLRYYIGDQLIGEVASVDGSIGGGTTGGTQIGTKIVAGADSNFLAANIDELMVLDRELCAEEIEATWLRITKYQPLGIALFTDMHDEGFPLPDNPASDARLDMRMTGVALGLAAAATENLRANFLPARAYGTTLDQWEELVAPSPSPTTSIEARRARVQARMSQRLGSSLDGFRDALTELLGGALPSQLEFLAFTNEITDDFTTLNLSRWDVTPVGSFTAASGKAHVAPGAGTFLMNGTTRDWKTCAAAALGDGQSSHLIAKLVFTTPQSVGEAGVHFGDWALGNYLLLGLRDNAGSFQIVTESFIANVSQGLVVQATPGANPAAIWFHLYQTDVNGTWLAAWSTTSATAGYATSSPITHPTLQNRAGFYLRSTGAIGAAVADFDDLVLRCPFGTRPYSAYVLLDRALGFSPDIPGARAVVDAIKHAFVDGTFITSRNTLYDDPDGGYDDGPMGGI